MREDQAKLLDGIDGLEPGGFGEQIIGGAVGIARLLEQLLFDAPGGLHASLRDLDEKVEALNERLDQTNELLHNMIKVLSSTK